jgi:hypothetical protein
MPRRKVLVRKLHEEHLSPNKAAATVMSNEYTNGRNAFVVHMFDVCARVSTICAFTLTCPTVY